MNILFLLVLASAFMEVPLAQGREAQVLIRRPNSHATIRGSVWLEDLTQAEQLEGRYFKIVKGKDDQAVSFGDQDQELVFKAATVYHHLTLARKYWAQKLKSQRLKAIPQIVVRLELTNQFDELGHFAHDNRSPQFNNALAIPAGTSPSWLPVERQRSWEEEIWFRPKKYIETKTIMADMGPNPLTQALQTLEGGIEGYAQGRLQWAVMQRLFYPAASVGPLWHELIRFAGTYALGRGAIQASTQMDALFLEKWYYLDAAMVPEVVFHEYTHIVLSDHLALSHTTPVVEGMADYFAAAISGQRKIYGHVSGHSNSKPKDTQAKRNYRHWDELNLNATADFVLSVLWDVRELLGDEVGDRVVYGARKYLTTSSATINDHLLRAILQACEDECLSPRRDKLRLYRSFADRGF
jgi:hypothetical protein